jgi:alanine-glyoxylate transaminase/serine-glyoxylate transaminase/serine-pyruvate transaminase
VRIPQGVDDATVRGSLLQEQNIELGAGLGKFAGKAWRIGLMGQNASIDRADFMADALIAKLR